MPAPLAGALTGRFRNGLAATILLLTAGIASNRARQWFMQPPGAPAKRWPLDYFATSRVIPNELTNIPGSTLLTRICSALFRDAPGVGRQRSDGLLTGRRDDSRPSAFRNSGRHCARTGRICS
ncbi:MAG: hypothetical protein WKF84_20115 [Pyrinomonadaceae bacterium]